MAVRCWRSSRQAWAAGMARHGSHPRLPARHGQRRQRVCRGFQGSFSFWGEAVRACCQVVLELSPAPVCWRIERGRGKQQPGGAPQQGKPRHGKQPPTHGPGGRRVPAQKLPPASWHRGNKQETPTPSTPEPDTRTPPRGLPEATEGNHGESTCTYSKGTLAGRVFRVEPPEDSLLTEPPMQRAK